MFSAEWMDRLLCVHSCYMHQNNGFDLCSIYDDLIHIYREGGYGLEADPSVAVYYAKEAFNNVEYGFTYGELLGDACAEGLGVSAGAPFLWFCCRLYNLSHCGPSCLLAR